MWRQFFYQNSDELSEVIFLHGCSIEDLLMVGRRAGVGDDVHVALVLEIN